MFKGIWSYRQLIIKMAAKDLRDKYVGTTMGFLWNIISPLLQILIYSIVFSQLMQVKMGNSSSIYAFAIYLCSGLLPWISFNEIILRGTQTFIENSAYLRKLPIPEVVFFVKNAISSFYSVIISVTILFVLNLVFGGMVSFAWICIPIYLILIVLFGYGLSIIFAVFHAFLRDVGQIVGVILQAWMWMTPIVYTADILPSKFKELLTWNPMYYFIDSIHKAIMEGVFPSVIRLFWMVFLVIITVAISHLLLNKVS